MKFTDRVVGSAVDFSSRRPFLVLLVWILLGVWGAIASTHLGSAISNSFDPPKGSESARVLTVMNRDFRSMDGAHLLLVLQGDATHPATDPAFQAYEGRLVARLRHDPRIAQVLTADQLRMRQALDPHVDALVMTFKGHVDQQVIVPGIRREIAQVAAPSGIQHDLTDMMAISYDIYGHTREQLARVERVGLVCSALVLIYVFGGFFAASLPLVIGLMCITLNNGLLTVIARFFETSTTNEFITAIVGLAIGIDYPLFLLSRFREELQDPENGGDPRTALRKAALSSGKAIGFSGFVVVASSMFLTILDVSGLRPAALSVAGVVAIALALCYTFLPALLFAVHRFYPLARLMRHRFASKKGADLWERLTRFVVDRPRFHFGMNLALLLALAVPVLGARFWSPTISMLPKQLESMRGLQILASSRESGQLSPIYVTATTPRPGGVYDTAFVSGLYGLVQEIRHDPRVAQVDSMVSFERNWPLTNYQAFFSNPWLRGNHQLSFLLDNGGNAQHALIRVVPKSLPDSETTRQLIRDLRDKDIPAHAAALPGVQVSVGGEQAQLLDMAKLFAHGLPLIAILNLVTITLILGIYFRSVFLPIKAIVMNMLPLLASFGVVIMVFQHGVGAHLIGADSPGYVMLMTPAVLLTVLFALSMDYEIIILSRIKEAYDRTGNNREAILEGLNRTGKVIAGAAAIMFSIFFAYVFADLNPMKEVGLGLATAILLDATVVRLVLLPSTMMLMGKWNYWTPFSKGGPVSPLPHPAGATPPEIVGSIR